jgi:hypothetical protein
VLTDGRRACYRAYALDTFGDLGKSKPADVTA